LRLTGLFVGGTAKPHSWIVKI